MNDGAKQFIAILIVVSTLLVAVKMLVEQAIL